ncbi:hypothetical protein CDL60_06890 [Roseateles noduli]|nr:hypothetical protein CDL60_06890 [Roseateles noduli]
MTITVSQAIEIADRHLSAHSERGIALRLLPDKTREFDVGWVFYYQSVRYLETGDVSDMLAGNNPLFIARSDGRLFGVDFHRPLEESLKAYRASGDLNARETLFVLLTGWREGALVIAAIRAIRQHATLGLEVTKQLVDSCLAGESPVVEVGSVAEAQALVQSLGALGFEASVRYEPSSPPIIPA